MKTHAHKGVYITRLNILLPRTCDRSKASLSLPYSVYTLAAQISLYSPRNFVRLRSSITLEETEPRCCSSLSSLSAHTYTLHTCAHTVKLKRTKGVTSLGDGMNNGRPYSCCLCSRELEDPVPSQRTPRPIDSSHVLPGNFCVLRLQQQQLRRVRRLYATMAMHFVGCCCCWYLQLLLHAAAAAADVFRRCGSLVATANYGFRD